MIQTLDILKAYITCPDAATRNKFYNLLDSFWHKNEGSIVKSHSKAANGDVTITLQKKDSTTENILLPALPNFMPISFIQDLEQILLDKVNSVPGKVLSSNDFTDLLLQKLNALQNYQHPEFHQISEIQDLAQILIDLAPPEGYGFSQRDFTPELLAKLQAYSMDHYGSPVNNLAELAAIPNTEYKTKQRRYVHSEGVDYFYDATVVEGDVAPADQVGGEGFWKRGLGAEILDLLTSEDSSASLSANQGRILKGLIDAINVPAIVDDLVTVAADKTLSANQGKVLKDYIDAINAILASDDVTLDQMQEVVAYIKANREDLENLSIPNIAGLVDALAGKAALVHDHVGLLERGAIGNAANLNTYITTGLYIQRVNSQAASGVNYPSPYAGVLEVVNSLQDMIYQKYHTYGIENKIYVRTFYTTWSAWKELGVANESKRLEKVVTNATQYTAILEDKNKHLVFTNPIQFIIPANIFAKDDLLEFKNESGGDVTVTEGAGLGTIQVVSSQSKKIPQYGFGGLRFRTATTCGLYGQLKPI